MTLTQTGTVWLRLYLLPHKSQCFGSHSDNQLEVEPAGRSGWRLVALCGERLTPARRKRQRPDDGSVCFSSDVVAKFKKDKSNHIKCSETLKEASRLMECRQERQRERGTESALPQKQNQSPGLSMSIRTYKWFDGDSTVY